MFRTTEKMSASIAIGEDEMSRDPSVSSTVSSADSITPDIMVAAAAECYTALEFSHAMTVGHRKSDTTRDECETFAREKKKRDGCTFCLCISRD